MYVLLEFLAKNHGNPYYESTIVVYDIPTFVVGTELIATDKWGNKMHSKPVAHQRPSSSKYLCLCCS